MESTDILGSLKNIGGFCGMPGFSDQGSEPCPMYDLEPNDPNAVRKCEDCPWYDPVVAIS